MYPVQILVLAYHFNSHFTEKKIGKSSTDIPHMQQSKLRAKWKNVSFNRKSLKILYLTWSVTVTFHGATTVYIDTGSVKGQIETNNLSAILSAPYVHTDNSVQIFMSSLKADGCCFLPSGQKRLWKV